MADVRCPMCGKPNEEHAEVCEFCGARIKPLTVGDSPPESEFPGAQQPENGDTWLSRMRPEGDEPEPEDAQEGEWLGRLDDLSDDDDEGQAADWLSRIGPDEEPALPDEPEAEPTWDLETGAESGLDQPSDGEGEEAEPEAEEEEVPDWLGRLRESEPQVTSGESPAEDEPPAADAPGAFDPAGFDAEGDEEPPAFEDEPESEQPEWLSGMREIESEEEGPPEGEIPEWLAADVGEPVAVPEAEDLAPAQTGELPDWLEELRAAGAEEADLEEEGPPDWMAEDRPPEEPEPISFESESFTEEDAPEPWDEGPTEPEPAAPEPAEPEPAEESAEGVPDWLSGYGETADVEEGEEVPDWLARIRAREAGEAAELEEAELEPSEAEAPELEDEPELEPIPEEEGLPRVPALILDDEGAGPPEQDDVDFDAIELPEWLSEARAAQAEAEAETPGEERSGDLAPATLPSWLEAMRPVETFQPVIDLEPEEDQVVESVGPLAGLRGVLSAEPVVAKPRAASIAGTRLEVTERQFAQADMLRRMVADEEREETAVPPERRPLPLLRWAVSLLLLVAVLLPIGLGVPSFSLPSRVPRDLGPLISLVNSIPTDRPVLMVFDYEPGFTGELDAVAGALLEHVMARELRVVTLSTRPTGPPLADRLVRRIGAPHQVENGRNYVHLGYLSGGPTAVQLFAASPRDAVLDGFDLPSVQEDRDPWATPLLNGVGRLSDFGMVAVITAGPDNARVWAEQAHPFMNETPLVMVLSAGAEPLVRPYFEGLNPQVNGILTGLPAAVAYEQVNGRAGDALARWNGFGTGMLVAELLLIIGVAYGISRWVLRARAG